jgi:tetratricopeptide (TPR) repeat protein
MKTVWMRSVCAAALLAGGLFGQQRGGGPGMRQGFNPEERLAAYQKQLEASPNSFDANLGAGQMLDLLGKTAEGRKHIQKAIDAAPDAAAKARAERIMAMSYAFDSDCKNAIKYEQMVIDYWATVPDYYQQGEMANEGARVCIDAGDLATAEKYYRLGTQLGLKQPDMPAGRKELWDFRLEHALARLAARRGNKAEAQKHIESAQAALDRMEKANAQLAEQQRVFFPYLTGYVAYYTGDYKTALADFQKANQNDAFIQCLLGMTYEKLGDKDKAMEFYRKASQSTAHNPPGAFARPFARKKVG